MRQTYRITGRQAKAVFLLLMLLGALVVAGPAAALGPDSDRLYETGHLGPRHSNLLAPPQISVAKSANPQELPAPGGLVRFQVQVTNNSAAGQAVALARLEDDLYGDLLNPGNPNLTQTTCGTTTIEPGQSYECKFEAKVSGNPGDLVTNTVTAKVRDANDEVAQASAQATVTISGASAPEIAVSKSANPQELPAPGGLVRFTVQVTNNSGAGQAITLARLEDDLYGDVTDAGNPNLTQTNCSLATIQPGDTYQCKFEAEVTGNPGDSWTDTVTAKGRDPSDQATQASAQASVTIRGAPAPKIAVSKSANPQELPAPGGLVRFTVQVTNNSGAGQAITLTRLEDDLYGDVTSAGNPNLTQTNCSLATIQPGDTYQCKFEAEVTGNPGDSWTDTVTAKGRDPSDQAAQASAQATVTISGAPAPALSVAKSANPQELPAPGGLVRFTVQVTNNSGAGQAITLTRLEDSLYGDVTNAANTNLTQTNCKLITIQPGDTYQCKFEAEVRGNPGDWVTNTVTAKGTDPFNEVVQGSAQATVTISGSLAPGMAVTKSANPQNVPAPGGPVRYTVQVTNNSGTGQPLTLTRLEDDLYGDITILANPNLVQTNCTLATIQPGDTYQCKFEAEVLGNPGDSWTDTVTAKATDPFNEVVQASARATVTIGEGEVPGISVSKAAQPTQLQEPGGPVDYTVKVTNNSPSGMPVALIWLGDDLYGDLTDPANTSISGSTCELVTIEPGQTYICGFRAQVAGYGGDKVTDTVTARAGGAKGVEVSASAQATVKILTEPPPTGVVLSPPAVIGGLGSIGFLLLAAGLLVRRRTS